MVDYKQEIETINDAVESLAKVGGLYLFKDFDKSKQIIEMQKELIEMRDKLIEKHQISM
jgi:chaperonin cofactor prefoldin